MLTFRKRPTVKAARLFPNVVAGAALAVAVSAGVAYASPIGSWVDYQFSSYTGNTNTVDAKITQTGANVLTFDLNQVGNTGSLSATVGEFRAFFFSVADASLLTGVTIAGSDVTSSVLSFGAVDQIPGDNDTKMNGGVCGGSGCLFDVGVGFGTTGLDNPAILSTSFTYTRTAGLDLSSFFATSGDIMGARLKSYASGEGSSKDACIDCTPTSSSSSSSSSSSGSSSSGSSSSGSSSGPGGQEVPEPAALGLLGIGLLGLGLMRRRKVD